MAVSFLTLERGKMEEIRSADAEMRPICGHRIPGGVLDIEHKSESVAAEFPFVGASVTDDEFRQRAVECRQLAATVTNPMDKAFWLRLAEDWMNIAAQAEKASGR
jgi:hypothetical protein